MPIPVKTRRSGSGSRRTLATLATATLALTGIFATTPLTGSPAAEAAAKTPNVKALAGDLAKQKLNWEKCDYADASINERFGSIANVLCATVKVPRDWHNPGNGKTWDIRISHAKNIDVKNARYKGTIFVNPGGPGGSGLPWAAAMQQRTPDMNPYYNYVGFDPRGVGQSSHASCDFEYQDNPNDPYAAMKAAGAACSANEDVRTISTEQTAYDMDFIRTLLAAPKLSYIGYSYGTWLGAWYEKVFGAKYGDKFVLDSSTDVTESTLQRTWEMQPIARDRQFQYHLMGWIARHDDEFKLGSDREIIYKEYLSATKDLDQQSLSLLWGLFGGFAAFPDNTYYPAAAATVQFFIEFDREKKKHDQEQEQEQEQENPAAALEAAVEKFTPAKGSMTAEELATFKAQVRALAKVETVEQRTGVAGAFGAKTLKSVEADEEQAPEVIKASYAEPFDFIRCNDGQWTQGAAYWNKKNAQIAKKAPLTAQVGGLDVPLCAYWRTNNLMPVADSTFPNTIVVQGEQDSQTAWETGLTSGTELPNTSFIAIDNEGSHGHFPYGTEAVDRPIYNYFLKGTMPKDIKVTQALPLPQETTVFESWKKLNAQAKHVGALADGLTPVGGAQKSTLTKSVKADSAALAKADAQAEKERIVSEIYGKKGVDALRKHSNG